MVRVAHNCVEHVNNAIAMGYIKASFAVPCRNRPRSSVAVHGDHENPCHPRTTVYLITRGNGVPDPAPTWSQHASGRFLCYFTNLGFQTASLFIWLTSTSYMACTALCSARLLTTAGLDLACIT